MNIIGKLGLYILFLFLICIGFSTHLSLSMSTAIFINSLKIPLILILIVVIFLSVIKKDLKKIIYPLNLSLIFPFLFFFINLWFKESLNVKVVIMYFLWSIFVFYLIPLWIDNEYRLKSVMKVFLFSSLITVSMAMIQSYLDGGYVTTMPDRESYGFQNPNYFSQYLQVSILSFSILVISMLKNGEIVLKINSKILIIFFFILFLYFCIEARSRNVIVGISAFTFWYLSYNFKKINRYAIRLSIIILILLILFVSDYETINTKSSGRLELWSFYIFHTIQSQDFGLLFGAYTYPDVSDLILSYNRLEYEGNVKFHADNLFIELFVEAGIIGVLIFFLPIIYMLYKRGNADSLKNVWTALLVSMLLQALFITNFSSFFSPISLFYAFIMSTLCSTKK